MLIVSIIGWAGLLIAWTWAWSVIIDHFAEKRAQAKQKQGG